MGRPKAKPVVPDKVETINCPEHSTPMTYNATAGCWQCTVPKCTHKKYPKHEVERFGGLSVVGQGPLEVLMYRDSEADGGYTIVLRAVTNNVIVEVTPHTKDVSIDKNGHMTLTLEVERVVDTDGITERDHFTRRSGR